MRDRTQHVKPESVQRRDRDQQRESDQKRQEQDAIHHGLVSLNRRTAASAQDGRRPAMDSEIHGEPDDEERRQQNPCAPRDRPGSRSQQEHPEKGGVTQSAGKHPCHRHETHILARTWLGCLLDYQLSGSRAKSGRPLGRRVGRHCARDRTRHRRGASQHPNAAPGRAQGRCHRDRRRLRRAPGDGSRVGGQSGRRRRRRFEMLPRRCRP